MISVIVPMYNEQDNVTPLYTKLIPELEALGRPFEVVCINDGSRDGTATGLDALAAADPRIKVIHFRANHGQTAAMMAGFDHAKGDIIIPIDGDLQNDPADIALMLAKLDEGYDVVSGWRKNRQDAALRRNLPSRIANRLISVISGVHLHDYGCSLKVYRRDVMEGVRLYGEMHRFIPIYASWQGGADHRSSGSPPPPHSWRIEIWPGTDRQGSARSAGGEVPGQLPDQTDLCIRLVGNDLLYGFIPFVNICPVAQICRGDLVHPDANAAAGGDELSDRGDVPADGTAGRDAGADLF